MTVRTEDEGGGFDEQPFLLSVMTDNGEIRGTKFIDRNGNGVRDYGQLLVTDDLIDQVLRYDGKTGAFVGAYPEGTQPSDSYGLAFGPDGNLYVSGFDSGNVVRYDGVTGAFLDVFVPSIPQPTGVTFGPDGNLYVSSYGTDAIEQYDGTSGAYLGAFAFGHGLFFPNGIVFGPDGNLYVAHFAPEGSSILRFNGTTGDFMDVFVSTGSGGIGSIAGLTFGLDGNLYAGDYFSPGEPIVHRYSGADGATLGRFTSNGVPSHRTFSVSFGPDGNLYVATADNNVQRFDGTTGAFIDQFVTPGSGGLSRSVYLAFSPNGESGVANWAIYLDQNRNGVRDPGERTTITDADGNYAFDNLPPATYVVREVQRSGWSQTFPGAGTVSPTGNGFADVVLDYFDSGVGPLPGPYGGTSSGGGPILVSLDVVLGDDPVGTFDALSLPTGSFVIVGFDDESAVDGPGNDLFVKEEGAAGEQAEIYVSSDRVNFVFLGLADNGITTSFDLASIGFTQPVRAVKIVGLDSLGLSPGFDVVNVQVLAGSIGPGDGSHVVVLREGQIVTDRDFGNQLTGALLPDAPLEFSSQPPTTATTGSRLRYDAFTNSPPSEAVTFDLPLHPDGMTIHPQLGALIWEPTSDQTELSSVVIRARDSQGHTALQSFQIDVSLPNRAPVFVSTPADTFVPGTTYRYAVNALDPDGDALSYSLVNPLAGLTLNPATHEITGTPTSAEYRDTVLADHPEAYWRLGETVELIAADASGQAHDGMYGPDNRATSAGAPFISTDLAQVFDGVREPVQVADSAGLNPQQIAIEMWLRPPAGGNTTYASPLAKTSDGSLSDGYGLYSVAPHQLSFYVNSYANAVKATLVLGEWNYVVGSYDGAMMTLFVNGQPAATMPYSVPIVHSSQPLRMGGAAGSSAYNWIGAIDDVAIYDSPLTADRVLRHYEAGTSAPVEIAVTDGTVEVHQAFRFHGPLKLANRPPEIRSPPRLETALDVPYFYQIQAVDPDNESLTYELVTSPHGMTIDSQGAVRWTPVVGQFGEHAVRVRAADARGGSDEQEFTLDVVATPSNTVPLITSTPRTAAIDDQPYEYHATARDADSDPVEWTLLQAPIGMFVDPRTGIVRWTPATDQLGLHTVSLQARDPLFGAAVQRFIVEVRCSNLPPAIVSVPPTTAVIDRPYLYPVRAVDLEHDPIRFSLETAPPGMTIDSLTGLIRWTPSADQLPPPPGGGVQPGSISLYAPQLVVVRAVDDAGAVGNQTYTIVISDATDPIANRPPVITSHPVFNAEADTLYQYQVTAADPDGDSLEYSLQAAPAGMTIDANGLIRWTPTAAQLGENIVNVVVRDSNNALATQGFVVLVEVNAPPTIGSSPPTTVTRGQTYRYSVRATDPNNDPLEYSLLAAPAGMTIDRLNGRILWNTNGAELRGHPVEVTVTDDHGQSASQPFTINVAADTTPPVVRVVMLQDLARIEDNATVDLGAQVRLHVTASDNVGVEQLVLFIGGQPVALDARREALVTAASLGTLDVRATATDAAGNVGEDRLDVAVVAPGSRENNVPVSTDPNVPPHPGTFDPNDNKPPIVEITSPEINATVTDLTPIIGSVDDPENNLWFYRVYTGRLDLVSIDAIDTDDPDWMVLNTGTTEVINGELAQFDPSNLTKDPYAIIVAAFDINGRGFIQPTVIVVEGNVQLGNFHLEFTDLSLPLAGIPIQVTRVYDTLDAGLEGDFGFGWSLGVQDARILETVPVGTAFIFNKTKVYLTNPEGRRVGFTFEPTCQGSLFGAICTSNFKADPGVYDQLIAGGQFGASGILGALSGPFNPAAYTLVTKGGLRYDYDQFRGLQTITDLNGNTVTFTDAGIRHSSGTSIDFIRDYRGRITEIRVPNTTGGQPLTLSYQYDAPGDLRSFTNQAGLTTRYEYLADPAHFLDRAFDPLGRQALEVRYQDGRYVGVFDALGNQIDQRDYDTDAHTAVIRDGNGNATTLLYDDRGNVLEETDPLGNQTIRRYEDPRNPDLETTIIDRRGNVTIREYDASGNLLAITERGNAGQPLNPPVVTEFTYDGGNHVTSITNALGHTTSFQYDAAGNLTHIINAEGNSAGFTYGNQGRRQTFTDFNDNTTTFEYDASCPCGSPSKVIFADGTFQLFEYNQYGQVTRETYHEANGTLVEVRETDYDNSGRVTEERTGQDGDPDHPMTVVRKFYAAHLLDYEIIVNPASPNETPAMPVGQRQSRIIDYEYDASDRLVRQIDAMGGVVEFRYDANGNRILLQDPVGNITTWVFDASNRVSEEHDPFFNLSSTGMPLTIDQSLAALQQPSGASCATNSPGEHVTLSCYDSEGNRSKKIDRNARRSEFAYDHAGRLLEERWYAAVTGDLVRTISFSYDVLGNMLTAHDPDSNYVFTYDTLNRLKSVDNAGTPGAPNVILTYGYDAQGNVTSTSDNFGVTVASTYNARNLLATRTWFDADIPSGQTADVDPVRVDFLYNAAGRQTRLDRYSDLIATIRVGHTDTSYDLSGRTDRLIHQNAVDELLASYDYGYDFSGLVTSELRDHQDNQFDLSITYGYDLTGQLVDALFTGQDDEHYEYDANGNRRLSRVGTETRSYSSPGPANQLTSDGVLDYAYDDEGNLIKTTNRSTGKATTYQYDHRNRLVQVENWNRNPGDPSNPAPGAIVTQTNAYTTDVFGRRIRTRTDANEAQDADTTHFVNNGDDAWADYNHPGDEVVRYLHDNEVDRVLVSWDSENGPSWYYSDFVGSVRDFVGSKNGAVNHVSFAAFGAPVGGAANRFLFTGREFDSHTNQYYYRSRWFDAQTGRFSTLDPITFRSGDVNLYRYVLNDPVSLADPYGLTILEYTITITKDLLKKETLKCLGKQIAFEFATQGLYLILLSNGTVYVGQSGDVIVRVGRHIKNLGEYIEEIIPIALPGLNKTEREIAESSLVNHFRQLFGRKSINVVDPIGGRPKLFPQRLC